MSILFFHEITLHSTYNERSIEANKRSLQQVFDKILFHFTIKSITSSKKPLHYNRVLNMSE
jgi:hypothetical protein